MKGGTAVQTSQTKHTDSMTTKKPTAEQIRYAQLLNTEDAKVMREKIKQVADVTGYNDDVVSIALHDCNFDTEATINALLEGRQDQSEWVMRTTKKKKHQTPVTQGIDTIIPTSQATPPTTTAPTSAKPGGPRQPRGKGRNRQSGEHSNSSEKDNKNEGTVTNNDRNAGESGRGRGSREDRWSDRKPGGRGGPPRRGGRGGGRPGRSFQSRGRDRPNRFGGGNRNASNSTAVNGPKVNGTEMWGDNDDDVSKEKDSEHTADLIPPTTEEWGTEEWTPVEQSVTSSTNDTLFNNTVSSSHSWPVSSDSSIVSWDVDTETVSNSTAPTVQTTDSRQKVPESNAPFTPESVDMAIIHSKLASNQPASKDQYSAVEFSMPRIPLPGELHNIHDHQDSISKLLDKVKLSASVGVSPQNSLTTIQAQPQRQPRTSRTKRSQKSQIPVQAVEMPGSMNDNLDVQFGNLEFGGDSVSSPRKKEEFPTPLPVVEDTRSDEQSSTSSSDSPSPPLESQHVVTSLPSSPITTSIPIATTASASSSVTTLEESSPRHFQHPSPRTQQQPLVSQVTKQITPEPIPLPSQLDSRENSMPGKPPHSNDQQNSPASLQPSGIPSPSLSGTNLNQTGSSSPLRPTLSSTMQKDITLDTRVYQKHHVPQPTVPSTKDKLGTNSLSSSAGSTSVPRNDLSSVEPLQPPPGVSVPLTVNQAPTSTTSGFTTVTMSGSGKPVSHTTKPSLPPGVLPMNTLYGMQQGLIHAYPLPYGYEDLQRLPMSAYYDMPPFQAAGREGLSTQFHGDQKFGRTDASSPVPTSLNQTVTLPQAHLQQQAFINATTMPHPYGYGGLAFYPGAGMMAGGFPAYTTPMYQMPTKTHGNASQYQSAYTSGQHGTHNFASGYDDLNQSHDFGKSGYHTSVSPSQSKSNAGAVVSSASDLSGASYKPQVGKFNDNKPFIGGTPPPALNLSMTGQHGPLGSYPHTGHPFMSMMTPVQQHHPPSHYHHHMPHHMETGQPGTSQRASQGQGPKQGQNKGHQAGYQGSPFWSGTN
ncbi:ubiquitin-associated protein 2-like isoform X1 [Orbicella faveolata]|uniref:ubiquitin-associated protein 2-like isoform X1 n=2 Tax=Orbicella faveolata TaxID=48498 RepID=UPI0009E4A597|nr:ubiquitin-associated protein 2-like isoform X1 [Orbicella faveolata]